MKNFRKKLKVTGSVDLEKFGRLGECQSEGEIEV